MPSPGSGTWHWAWTWPWPSCFSTVTKATRPAPTSYAATTAVIAAARLAAGDEAWRARRRGSTAASRRGGHDHVGHGPQPADAVQRRVVGLRHRRLVHRGGPVLEQGSHAAHRQPGGRRRHGDEDVGRRGDLGDH